MNTKGSLYAVIGGVVGAVLTLAVCSVMPIGAQNGDATFDRIYCTDLFVRDTENVVKIALSAGHPSGGFVYLKDDSDRNKTVLRGGRVSIYDGEHELVDIRPSEHGGVVSVRDKNSEQMAVLSINKHGGQVGVFGKGSNESRVQMGVTEYGYGAVSTWDKNGYRVATLK